MVNHHKIEQAHAIFKARRYTISKSTLLNLLQCSPSTLKRTIKTLREEYAAPLIYDSEAQGYRYTDDKFELSIPSFWLAPDTLLALVSTQKLLEQLNLNFLNDALGQIRKHIETCLKRHKIRLEHLHRIRILPINARIHDHIKFQQITAALLQRQTLDITYYSRGKNETSHRIISPQRLAHYKDNWYLDVWCHLRKEFRMFSLDGIRDIRLAETACIDVDEAELDTLLTSGYGIFSGAATHVAVLRFSAQRARWVADEQWHPQQIASWHTDGRYQLQIPYADARELLMDIQRHLPEVEIISPLELKQALLQHLQQAMEQHQKK